MTPRSPGRPWSWRSLATPPAQTPPRRRTSWRRSRSRRNLDARARVVVIEEARRRGLAATQVEAYELLSGPDDDDALKGRYLWFDIDDFEVELGPCRQADAWRTLRPQTLD